MTFQCKRRIFNLSLTNDSLQATQKETIADLVGSEELADKYVQVAIFYDFA